MLKYAVLILWRKKGVPANFYAFCISDDDGDNNNDDDNAELHNVTDIADISV